MTELQSRTIESLDARLEHIALLPSVISRLAALDLDSPTATDEILALIRSDPPLALRLLRLANSPILGVGGVKTIPDAILRAGAQTLANLVIAMSVVEVFIPHTRGQRNLWIHSIQTAMTARRLAAMRPDLGLGMEESFLAGLLHDIGRFVIFEYRPQNMAELDEADVADPRELIAAEIRICGFDHAALGFEVCRRWHLTESVSEMVRSHHIYGELKRQIPLEVAGLVRLVQEADCFSFGLLRNPTSSNLSAVDRTSSIERSLHLLPASERILSTTKIAEELINIDHDSRLAAAFVNIAYA